MKGIIFYIFFGFISIHVTAHEGIGLAQDYDNVRVRSYKETDMEDFRKAFIIGQLASKLAKKLLYTEPIFLDCRIGLQYIDSVVPTDYQISVQHHKYWNEEGDGSEKLIIRQQAMNYDVIETLKLVEYAIKNKAHIKEQQQPIKSTFFYDRGSEKLTIGNDLIQNILQQPHSKEVGAVMQTRINRPLFPEERPSNITYYWQADQFHIYRHRWVRKDDDQPDIVLLTVPTIQQFENLGLVFLVFDTAESFYYLNINMYDKDGLNKVSSRHLIEDIGANDFGKEAKALSNGDVSIYFTHGAMGSGRKRLLLYFYETDTLIQDVYAATGVESSDLLRQLREGHKNRPSANQTR